MLYDYSSGTKQVSQSETVRSYDGKVIGYLKGDVFVKPVCASKHQLKKPPAWAVDAEAFDHQIKSMAKLFRIKDSETGNIYEVTIEYFDQHKGEFDRRFGRQYFLPLNQWRVIELDSDKPRQLALALGDNS